jgi:hypothetical protein
MSDPKKAKRQKIEHLKEIAPLVCNGFVEKER